MPVLLHLVRHGRSTWNERGLLQGRTAGVPLSPTGLAQALALSDELAGRPVAEIWCSDQLRCAQTAEIVAARQRLPVCYTALLREQGHGVWEGRPAAGRDRALAEAGPDWAPAGGETFREVHARAALFLHLLRARPGAGGRAEIVVVTHGETLRALLAVVARRRPEAAVAELPRHAVVRQVLLPDDGTAVPAGVVAGDTAG